MLAAEASLLSRKGFSEYDLGFRVQVLGLRVEG